MHNNITHILESRFGDESQEGKKWEDYETIVCPDGEVIDMVALIDEQHKAVAGLMHIAPELMGFLSSLSMIYTFRVQTQATDGLRIFVNPQFTNKLSFTEKCFVMAHEVMHCLLNHNRRLKGIPHYEANIAADYEVNDTLVACGLFKEETIKKIGAFVDMKYTDMGCEKIFDIMPQKKDGTMDNSNQSPQAEKNQQTPPMQGKQGSGGGTGSSQKQTYSDEYKAGWKKAIEDWKAGKIKI